MRNLMCLSSVMSLMDEPVLSKIIKDTGLKKDVNDASPTPSFGLASS